MYDALNACRVSIAESLHGIQTYMIIYFFDLMGRLFYLAGPPLRLSAFIFSE